MVVNLHTQAPSNQGQAGHLRCHHGDDAGVLPHPQSLRVSGQHGKAGPEQKEAVLGLGHSGKAVLVARERKAHSSMNLHASAF